jgi:hypothetical protein
VVLHVAHWPFEAPPQPFLNWFSLQGSEVHALHSVDKVERVNVFSGHGFSTPLRQKFPAAHWLCPVRTSASEFVGVV